MARIVVGLSGASGIILGYKTVQILLKLGHQIDLVVTSTALMTAKEEMGEDFSTAKKLMSHFEGDITLHGLYDFMSPIASGSCPVDAMVIVPCSMSTLAGVALGLSDNLLRRAADVTLKEKKPLVIVPRETPLSAIHLRHMLTLSEMGAFIVPPMPAWYQRPESLHEAENFIVGKVLDCLRIRHALYPLWHVAPLTTL